MGKPINFFQNGDSSYVALSGVYALADPGDYPLQLTVQTASGARYRAEQLVEIQSGGYPTDPHLTVPPETIDPAVTAPENELVASIVQPATPEKYWEGIFTCPGYNPKWITSWFGDRRYYNDDPKVYFHTGVDYNGGIGIPVKAAAAGVVAYTGEMVVRGNVTFINHGWGIYTVYFHQSEIDVKVGDRVEPGQTIGLVGATGRVTGAHLHWELWVNGFQSDPLDWLDREYP
jgi:murein DD-endopeptidase MepM/ murein hydrolase activator NlpD